MGGQESQKASLQDTSNVSPARRMDDLAFQFTRSLDQPPSSAKGYSSS